MSVSEVEIRPTKASDVLELLGKPNGQTVKAWSVFWKGELVCIAGYTLQEGGAVVFSDLKPDLKAPKVLIWKTIKRLMALIEDTKTPLYTVRNPKRENSDKFLTLLGFQDSGRTNNGYHVYHRGN